MLKEIAYTILGVAIIGFTYYVTSTTDVKPALYVFFVVGFGLVVYGTFSLIQGFINPEGASEPHTNDVIACPNCGVKHYTTSNYCHKCGAEL